MKNTILAITIALTITTLFISCSKDDPESFAVTDQTGTTIIKGTITHDEYNSGNEIGLEGAEVTVRIWNSDLYPNSPNAQGSKTYTGVSDANGNYSVSAKTNGDGVEGVVTYSPVTLTVDATTGEQETYSYSGETYLDLYKGVTVTNNRYYNGSTIVDISDIEVDSAIVRGTIEIQHWVQQDDLESTFFMLENQALPNYTVTLVYDQDPTTLLERTYETVTDANGDYSFTVETCDFDYDLDNDYRVRIPNFDSARDSILYNGTVLSSTPGVFWNENESGDIEGGEIHNAIDLLYNNFNED